MKRDLTIIIIGRNNFLKSIAVSSRIIISIFLLFAIIIMSTIIFFVYNTRLSITEIKQNIAEEQHQGYLKKIAELKICIKNLKDMLESQIAVDNKERNFFQIASIHPDVWAMGIGGSKGSHHPINFTIYNSRVLDELYESVDILRAQTKLRHRSIQEMGDALRKKIDLWRHIPSINPVPGAEVSSGFGYRVDPFTKDVRMHEGVDLSASKGTPVYATADGIVTFADWNMGYGYVIDIDHGYGFVSRYAHLSKILVKEGEFIKRRQVIGRVGATGRAVCSHLHYEVMVAGIKVDPINYIDFKDVVVD